MPSRANRAIILSLAQQDDLEIYDTEATFRVNINAFTNANIYRQFIFFFFYIELVLKYVKMREIRNIWDIFPMYSMYQSILSLIINLSQFVMSVQIDNLKSNE